MKKIIFLMWLGTSTLACSQQATIALSPTQSMAIAGLKPGQNGAINPYAGEKSIAVIRNVSDKPFSVRIQRGKTIVKEIPVSPRTKLEFVLEKDQAFYLDTEYKTKARIGFKKYKDATP